MTEEKQILYVVKYYVAYETDDIVWATLDKKKWILLRKELNKLAFGKASQKSAIDGQFSHSLYFTTIPLEKYIGYFDNFEKCIEWIKV